MKIISFVLILGLHIKFCFSQKLVPYLKSNDTYIYVDSVTMKPLISTEFDFAYPFQNGVAKVGMCEENKKIKTYCFYGDIKYGLINLKGEIILPIEYNVINNFKEGFAFVGKGDLNSLNKANYNWSIPDDDDIINDNFRKSNPSDERPYLSYGEGGYVNLKGQFLLPLTKNLFYGKSFSEGFSWFITHSGKYLDIINYNLINDTGAIKNNFKYVIKDAKPFSDGLSAVKINNDKWGFVNNNGEFVIDPFYDDVGSFKNGLAPVRLKEKWGYINPDNQLKIPLKFSYAKEFSEGLASVSVFSGNHSQTAYFIDVNGNVKSNASLSEIYFSSFKYGIAISDMVAINKSMKQLFSFSNEFKVTEVVDNKRLICSKNVRSSDQFGLIDSTGRIILPFYFSLVKHVYGNLFYVEYNIDCFASQKRFIIDVSTGKKFTQIKLLPICANRFF
jgi:hypothetical protein